jgi:hypothetical protein
VGIINNLKSVFQPFILKVVEGLVVGRIFVKHFLNVYALAYFIGVPHPQGHGKLKKVPCKVVFDILVPIDPQACPYYIWASKGIHTHQPPPPIKTPGQILQGFVAVIKRQIDPNLSPGNYLT